MNGKFVIFLTTVSSLSLFTSNVNASDYEVKLFKKHMNTALFAAKNEEWTTSCINARLAKSIALNAGDKDAYTLMKKFSNQVCSNAGLSSGN